MFTMCHLRCLPGLAWGLRKYSEWGELAWGGKETWSTPFSASNTVNLRYPWPPEAKGQDRPNFIQNLPEFKLNLNSGTSHTSSVQFRSFWFDNPGNAASPVHGDGDDIITEVTSVAINGIAQNSIERAPKTPAIFIYEVHLNHTTAKRCLLF